MLAMLLLQTPAEVERFLAKVAVDEVSDCWVWVAGRFSNGYGCFKLRGGSRLAHRVAYTTWRGPIPDDKVLDHVVCDSPPCCNPWHTEPRTTAQNVLRGDGPCARNARKTHCASGHSLEGENLYVNPLGKRNCRVCLRRRGLAYYYRKTGRA